jgi:hypothetical protein
LHPPDGGVQSVVAFALVHCRVHSGPFDGKSKQSPVEHWSSVWQGAMNGRSVVAGMPDASSSASAEASGGIHGRAPLQSHAP